MEDIIEQYFEIPYLVIPCTSASQHKPQYKNLQCSWDNIAKSNFAIFLTKYLDIDFVELNTDTAT